MAVIGYPQMPHHRSSIHFDGISCLHNDVMSSMLCRPHGFSPVVRQLLRLLHAAGILEHIGVNRFGSRSLYFASLSHNRSPLAAVKCMTPPPCRFISLASFDGWLQP